MKKSYYKKRTYNRRKNLIYHKLCNNKQKDSREEQKERNKIKSNYILVSRLEAEIKESEQHNKKKR